MKNTMNDLLWSALCGGNNYNFLRWSAVYVPILCLYPASAVSHHLPLAHASLNSLAWTSALPWICNQMTRAHFCREDSPVRFCRSVQYQQEASRGKRSHVRCNGSGSFLFSFQPYWRDQQFSELPHEL